MKDIFLKLGVKAPDGLKLKLKSGESKAPHAVLKDLAINKPMVFASVATGLGVTAQDRGPAIAEASEKIMDYLEAEQEKTSGNSDELASLFPGVTLYDVEVYREYRTHKRMLTIRKKDNAVLQLDPQNVIKKAKELKDGNVIDVFIDIKNALFVFNPFDKNHLLGEVPMDNYVDIPVYNEYRRPKWLDEPAPVPGQARDLFNRLLDHLILDPKDRRYVRYVFQQTFFTTQQIMLILVGGRGTGKNLLIDILGSLHGSRYYQKLSESAVTTHFNGALENIRIGFFDDVQAKGDEVVNKLKQLINTTNVIEKKGLDAFTAQNYTLFVLAANNNDCITVTPQERKFSPIRCTNTPLTKIFTPEEIDFLATIIKKAQAPWDNTDPHLADIGNYVLEYKPLEEDGFRPHYPYKSKLFYEMCAISQTNWQRVILDHIVKNEVSERGTENRDNEVGYTVRLDAIKFGGGKYNSKAPGVATIRKFFQDFINEEKEPILEMVLSNKHYFVKVLRPIPEDLVLSSYIREEEIKEIKKESDKYDLEVTTPKLSEAEQMAKFGVRQELIDKLAEAKAAEEKAKELEIDL